MIRAIDVGRAVAIAALGGLMGAACLVSGYALTPDLVVSMDVDPTPLVRGLYPIERAPDGLTFAWSRDVVRMNVPGLDRQHAWEFRLRFRGPRADPGELPDVTIDVDGVTLGRARGSHDLQDLSVTLPTIAGDRRGAQIVVRPSNTFVPGPGDTRALGIQIDDMRLVRHPHEVPIAPRAAIAAAALGGAIFGALFGLIGVTAGSAALGVAALACGQAAVMVAGAGPYTTYATRVPVMAAWIALGAIAIVWIVERLARQPLRNTARFVAVFSSAAAFLKLLVLLHPDMPIGDALFQAHRFEWVRAGRWFFTSVAPGGYEFPYAVGLYAAALPLADLVQGTAGFMALLRVLVALVDTGAGALLYPAIVSSTGNRLAGAMAVGLYHLLPLNFQVQTVGNLTNAFGQSLFVVALALLVLVLGTARHAARPAGERAPAPRATDSRAPDSRAANSRAVGSRAAAPRTTDSRAVEPRPGRRTRGAGFGWGLVGWGAFCAAAAGAMLSHTSTFAIALPVLLLAVVIFRWRGGDDVAPRAWPLLAAAVAATVLAIGLYYAHFGETYAAQFARISAELSQPAELSDPGGRSVARRATAVPYYLATYYGWPALVLAVIGIGALAGRRDAMTLTLWAWLGGTLTFLVLGVVTPLDFRHYLAAFPAVAILAGYGAAHWWARGPVQQAAALVLLAAALLVGVRGWIAPL